MKLNGSNLIIKDTDIQITNSTNYGKNLGQVLSDQSQDINTLKSNVKWIYQNGGVGGSGYGGSGSGSGAVGDWSIYAMLNNTPLNNGNTMLNGVGVYYLDIAVNNANGKTYSATYKYTTGGRLYSKTVILDASNAWECSIALNLVENADLVVQINDGNVRKSVTTKYITKPFEWGVSIVDRYGNAYSDPNNDIMINNAMSNGLKIRLNYDIAAEGQYYYTVTDILGHEWGGSELGILDASAKIYDFNITDDQSFVINNQCAGVYTFIVKLSIHVAGQNTITEEKRLTFNLIPDSLYLKILPESATGQVYLDMGNVVDDKGNKLTHKDLLDFQTLDETTGKMVLPEYIDNQLIEIKNSRNVFNQGIISFIIQGYYGAIGDRNFELSVYVDDEYLELPYTSIKERERKIMALSSGLPSNIPHKLTVYLGYNSENSITEYYFYVKEIEININWYENNNQSNLHYYKPNTPTESCGMFDGLIKKYPKYIEMTANTPELKISRPSISCGEGYDMMFCMGIQYSYINNTNLKLCTISGNGGTITIYQNKVVFNDNIIDIFIPKEKNYNPSNGQQYHLLTIYKRYICRMDGTDQYEFVVYLDGVIEGALEQYITIQQPFTQVILNPSGNQSNFCINLLELSYFQHTDATTNVRNSTYPSLAWFDDNNIVRYWYTFCGLLRDSNGYTENRLKDLEYYKYFNEYHEYSNELGFNIGIKDTSDSYYNIPDGMIACPYNDIENIAKNSDIPTLLFICEDTNTNVASKADFYTWFTATYEEWQLSSAPARDVEVYYSPGNEELQLIDASAHDAKFQIELQGSSTGKFRSKNLDLSIVSKQEDSETAVVYTPNLVIPSENADALTKNEAYKTFLPERRFTLKADVVDSSHSNNTTMGEFINANTAKFNTKQSPSQYTNYIKNCLMGFPVQVFISVKTTNQNDAALSRTDNYYLGIYNFNLGRDSYHNLGYVDLKTSFEVEDEGVTKGKLISGFNIYTIPNYQPQAGLLVAEISGGDSHFDFSQFDNSILFDINDSDKSAMFGDIVTGTGKLENDHKTVIQNFVKHIAMSGGFLFYKTGKNLGDIEDVYSAALEDMPIDSINQVPDWRVQYIRQYEGNGNVYTPSTNQTLYNELNTEIQSDSIPNSLIKTIKQYSEESGHYPYLDYRSLVEYYTICMTMGLVDSVQKNLNIKTWTAKQTNSKNELDPTFYIAFYDMDTCLGIDNGGNDVSYFAFSDYWKSTYTEDGDVVIPNIVKVYRDFYPNGDACKNSNIELPIGYDIPSSFLFAIAKYARIFDKKTDAGTYTLGLDEYAASSYPGNLYASWRKSSGVLANAEKFVTNYFAKQLNKVSECALNYNYRMKYLVKSSGKDKAFMNYNFTPFKGKRVYRLTDWMNGRLHILDAYFNLNATTMNFEGYDKDNNTWYPFVLNNENLLEAGPSPVYIDNTNKDITILNDIFTSAGSQEIGQKYNSTINAVVEAGDYSPVIIYTAQKANKYLLQDSSKQYRINLPIEGSIATVFGGSSEWISISDISSFIPSSNTFTINSDKLNYLTGTKGVCNLWNINLPSVKKIVLTSPNYSGDLTLSNTINFPNLNEINISNTKINLKLEELGLTKITANNVIASKLIINNCLSLTDFSWTNASIDEVTINPIWTSNFTLNGYNSNKVKRMILNGKKDTDFKIELKNLPSLEYLSVSGCCTSLIVTDCPKLKQVIINSNDEKNNKQTTLKTLKINKCNTTSESLFKLNGSYNNVEIGGYVKLSNFIALETLSFSETLGIRCVDMPIKDFVLTSGIFNKTGIKYINTVNETDKDGNVISEGRIIIKNGGIFSGYTSFRPIQCNIDTAAETEENVFVADEERYMNLVIHEDTTALNNLFNNTLTTSEDAIWFLDTICKEQTNTTIIENISSISGLFGFCSNVKYTAEDFIDDYPNERCKYDLSIFVNVTNASHVFNNTGVKIIHKYMFKGLCNNLHGKEYIINNKTNEIFYSLNILYFAGCDYITLDCLYYIIDIMHNLPWYMPGSLFEGISKRTIIDIEATLNTSENPKFVVDTNIIKLADLFNHKETTTESNTEYTKTLWPGRLQEIYNFNFTNDCDFRELFINGYEYKIHTIVNSFGSYGTTKMNNPEVDGSGKNISLAGINNLKELEIVYGSFNINNENDVIDLYNFFAPEAWTNIFNANTSRGQKKYYSADVYKNNAKNKFASPINEELQNNYYGCLSCYKVITKANMQNIFKDYIIPNSNNITGINNLFKDTFVLINGAGDNELSTYFVNDFNEPIVLPNLTSCTSLFDNMKFVNYSGNIINFTSIDNAEGNIIPILLTDKTTKLLSNSTDFRRTFANLILASNLPFDFFNKRYEETVSSNIYVRNYTDEVCYFYKTEPVIEYVSKETITVDPSTGQQITEIIEVPQIKKDENGNVVTETVIDESKGTYFFSTEHPAILHRYKYRNDISYFTECFTNMYLCPSTNSYSFDSSALFDGDTLKQGIGYDYIECTDEACVGIQYTSYTTSSKQPHENIKWSYVVFNTELSDCLNIKGLHDNTIELNYYNQSNELQTGLKLTNYFMSNSNDANRLIYPPDIIYPVVLTRVPEFNKMFYNSNAVGVLPKNMFKEQQTKGATFTNMFYNNFVVPQYIENITQGNENIDIYVYVPKNFTTAGNLSSSFNFKFNVPQGYPVRRGSNAVQDHNAVFIFHEDSISANTTSLSNLLGNANQLFVKPTNHFYLNYDYGIRFNIMYKIDEETHSRLKEGTTDEYEYYTVRTLNDGINMDKFSKLYLDNLINDNIVNFIYGKIFNEGFDIGSSKCKVQYDTSAIITAGKSQNDSVYASFSHNIILPKASAAKPCIIKCNWGAWNVTLSKTNNVIDGEKSSKYYHNDYLDGDGTLLWVD